MSLTPQFPLFTNFSGISGILTFLSLSPKESNCYSWLISNIHMPSISTSEALRSTQKHSEALRSTQKHSVHVKWYVVRGTQYAVANENREHTHNTYIRSKVQYISSNLMSFKDQKFKTIIILLNYMLLHLFLMVILVLAVRVSLQMTVFLGFTSRCQNS